jgi:hypothetical protein
MNKNFAELDAQATTQLYYDATTGLPSISIGVQQDKSSAIKVAKSGFDVTTTGNANLAFNSAQNVFKIIGTGSVTVTSALVNRAVVGVAMTGVTTNYAHGLSIIPGIVGFVFDGAYSPLPAEGISSTNGNYYVRDFIELSVDATNVSVFITSLVQVFVAGAASIGPNTYTIKYYLLQETAN